MIIAELKDLDNGGKVIGIVPVSEKSFKTGSRGYYGQGKIEYAGKRYQVSTQLVEIGSKPTAEAEAGK